MKKVMLLFFALLLGTSALNAKNVKIYRHGSDDGVHYDKVNQSNTLFLDKLSCSDPGAIRCAWVSSAPYFGDISSEVIENWVMQQISEGSNSGTTRYNNAVLVVWEYLPDTDELTITMTDEF
jgi:hypothetical protein